MKLVTLTLNKDELNLKHINIGPKTLWGEVVIYLHSMSYGDEF